MCDPARSARDAAREELDALMTEAMREHMRSDVPFGLFLSGGTDSAILAGQLEALGAGRIQSFSVGIRGEQRGATSWTRQDGWPPISGSITGHCACRSIGSSRASPTASGPPTS